MANPNQTQGQEQGQGQDQAPAPAPAGRTTGSDVSDGSSLGGGRRVTVVGAGFSGLATAFHLVRAGFSVEIVEEQNRAGGLIATRRTPQGYVETAANGLLNSAAVEELFREVGLPIVATKREARSRYIFRNGRPRRWPLGLQGTLSMVRFVFRFLFRKKKFAPREGETVRDWSWRALGREAASYTVEAFLQGVYAGDPGRMSARLLFGRMFGIAARAVEGSGAKEKEKEKVGVEARLGAKPRVKPSIRGTVSAPEGMGQLIEARRRYLEHRGVTFRYGQRFDFAPGTADHPIVIATAAHQAARILESHQVERSARLKKIEVLPLVSATVFFRQTDEKSRGFGCLFPPIERRRVLGVLKNNFIFEGRVAEGFSETWILGGASATLPNAVSLSDQEILKIIEEERRACFQVDSDRIQFVITRWPQALPHYTTELERELPSLIGFEGNVILIGNYLGQIGLAKILERAGELPYEIASRGRWLASSEATAQAPASTTTTTTTTTASSTSTSN